MIYLLIIEKSSKTDINGIKDNQVISPGGYDYINKKVRSRIKQVKEARGMIMTNKQNSKVFSTIGRDLASYTGVHTRSQIRAKNFEKAVQFIED